MTTKHFAFGVGYCGTCGTEDYTDGFAVECSFCGGTLIVHGAEAS